MSLVHALSSFLVSLAVLWVCGCAAGSGPGYGSAGAGGDSSSSNASGSTAAATGSSAPSSGGTTSAAAESGGNGATGNNVATGGNVATNGNGAGASAGSTSTATSIASTGTTSAGTEPCPTPSTLIDDMENGKGAISAICGRTGYWYTYNDMTTGGAQTPEAGMTFTDSAVVPPRTTGDGGASSMAARTTGSGFTAYGAGMGFDLDDPGAGAAKHPYDASSYSGVTFWAMGSAGGSVRFNVSDKASDPSGGVCMGSTGTAQCNDHHGHALTLTATWQQFTFTWSQLTQQGFGYVEATLDTSHLIGMQFQIGVPTGSFDVWIDDIAFTP